MKASEIISILKQYGNRPCGKSSLLRDRSMKAITAVLSMCKKRPMTAAEKIDCLCIADQANEIADDSTEFDVNKIAATIWNAVGQ